MIVTVEKVLNFLLVIFSFSLGESMSIFNKIKSITALTVGILLFGISSIFGFQVSGESFDANFKISSWTATKSGSIITSEGIVGEGYGKVYLTHL